ncbi:unnamed protein product [Ranitomeya imitator]|uniref:Trifunctional purine biosynthetic protein adenosine-3 n=1 Tax=Ranitomeya imitator TaxID=111125 RepID=A0ABN9L2Q6_9NEOB|nr:unnamed protein product [Ranitomeya imitator]
MVRHGIPTAKYKSFTNPEEACDFITSADFRALVVKASGLAAGKGVIVAGSKEEACKAVKEIMQDRTFGEAGDTVVVEELLEGEEVSCLCFTDGLTVAPMPPAQDHKRLMDEDQGPNTGGMGAYCPVPQVSKDLLDEIRDSVLQRTVNGIREEGAPYVGVLYAGLMLTKDGPKVLEYNCRFGDPECQVILPLLQSDLYEVIQATIDGQLAGSMPVWLQDHAAVTVVMASGGYPGSYSKGLEITGLTNAQTLGMEVFHAGTALKDGKVVTSGGRVLTVTSLRKDLPSALEEANKGASAIDFPGAVYRKDIGFRAIAYLRQHRHLTYKDSGVDIEAGNNLVRKIKPFAAATARPGCNAELGGFAGLFDLKAAGFIDPILVSGTDGVGTKLKIAQSCDKHDTIGQDLVAMCVNDILAQGAEPLFFLDYFGCGALDVSVAESVVSGIAKACQMAGCALLGGETAEMPGMYAPGEYDLAGFAVGAVERGCMLPRLEKIAAGDLVIGVSSSGLHSNGFSLVRKIVEKSSLELSSPSPPGCGTGTLGEMLLTPTKIYSKALLPVLKSGHVKAYAHITGGGLLENIPRVLPASLGKEGGLSEEEMSRTFNCGIGAVLVVEKMFADVVLKEIQAVEDAWLIGEVILLPTGSESVKIENLSAALNSTEPPAQKYTSVCDGEHPAVERRVRVAVLISGTASSALTLRSEGAVTWLVRTLCLNVNAEDAEDGRGRNEEQVNIESAGGLSDGEVSTNLDALIRSTQSPSSAAHIALVISNKAGVGGLQKAEAAGIPTKVIDHRPFSSREEFDGAVGKVLEEFSIELVCLAGFMRILSGPFVRRWNGKILNIHPSLLPSFKGAHAHKLVLEAGVRVTGCTVHFVAEEVDAGAIVYQEAVPVEFGDTVDSLSERVKKAEHKAFPAALQLVASGAAKLGEDGKICWNKDLMCNNH